MLLQAEKHRSEDAEATIEQLQIRGNELECRSRVRDKSFFYLSSQVYIKRRLWIHNGIWNFFYQQNMENQLHEISTALEDARAQLISGRAAAVSLEADPTHKLCKGKRV